MVIWLYYYNMILWYHEIMISWDHANNITIYKQYNIRKDNMPFSQKKGRLDEIKRDNIR